MKQQQGNTFIIILALALVALLVVWKLTSKNYVQPETGGGAKTPAIVTKDDVGSAGKNLDETDLNQIDVELNQLNVESSAF